MSKEKTIVNVKGMSCSHCVHAVKTAVGALAGVGNVDVELESGKVTVDYDPGSVTLAQIKEAIEDQGYDVAD